MTARRQERGRVRPGQRRASPSRRLRELHLFIEGEVTEKSYVDRLNELGQQRFFLNVHGYGKPREIAEAAIQLRAEELRRPMDRRDPSTDVWKLLDSLGLRY